MYMLSNTNPNTHFDEAFEVKRNERDVKEQIKFLEDLIERLKELSAKIANEEALKNKKSNKLLLTPDYISREIDKLKSEILKLQQEDLHKKRFLGEEDGNLLFIKKNRRRSPTRSPQRQLRRQNPGKPPLPTVHPKPHHKLRLRTHRKPHRSAD